MRATVGDRTSTQSHYQDDS
ncbi:hypothetical protein LINPERHAP1_LOCUS1420 [Linum perenne]